MCWLLAADYYSVCSGGFQPQLVQLAPAAVAATCRAESQISLCQLHANLMHAFAGAAATQASTPHLPPPLS
jgi:hypothetical protein